MTTTETDEQLLVSRHKARHILGDIGETKLWELDKAREIEVVRIGRRAFVTAESLRSYVERLRAAAAETADESDPQPPDVDVAAQQRVHGGSSSVEVLAAQRD